MPQDNAQPFVSPITNEKMAVQAKSKANLQTHLEYEGLFKDMRGHTKFFLVVHRPNKGLAAKVGSTGDVGILGPREGAKLCVGYGLSEWIPEKAV